MKNIKSFFLSAALLVAGPCVMQGHAQDASQFPAATPGVTVIEATSSNGVQSTKTETISVSASTIGTVLNTDPIHLSAGDIMILQGHFSPSHFVDDFRFVSSSNPSLLTMEQGGPSDPRSHEPDVAGDEAYQGYFCKDWLTQKTCTGSTVLTFSIRRVTHHSFSTDETVTYGTLSVPVVIDPIATMEISKTTRAK